MATHPYSLPVGGLVGQTIGVYLRNLIPFTMLGALVLSPWIALRIAIGDADASNGPRALSLLATLVQALLSYILIGAVTYGVVQQLRDQPAGIGLAISQGLSSFLRVLGTAFLCGIRIFLWSLLLWIPGIVENVKLYVAIPAAVMEGKSSGAAVERSKSLTRGSGWAIFGAWLLIFLISFGLGMIGFFVLHSRNSDVVALPLWLEIAIALLVNPFSATMASVAYFMLRQGKENIDATKIAAVFD